MVKFKSSGNLLSGECNTNVFLLVSQFHKFRGLHIQCLDPKEVERYYSTTVIIVLAENHLLGSCEGK